MKVLGKSIHWADPPTREERSLAQVTDIGVAFAQKQAQLTGSDVTGIPAVFRGFQVLTDTVASLHMEEVIGKVASPETPSLLSSPDPTETYHDSISKIMSSLLFRGNAYLWPRTREAGTGIIKSVYVLNPDEVVVTPDTQNLYPVYTWRGKEMTPDSQIVHIKLNSWPGRFTGVGPIEAARLMMEGAQAEQTLASNLMIDDGTPNGVLTAPDKMTSSEAQAVLDIWLDTHGKGKKQPGVLTGGMEWKPLMFSPVDAQFIEQRNFTIQDVGRLLGLPGLFLLVDSGSSLTYATTESLFRLWLTMTLAPTYLERIEQSFSRLMPSGTKARFNVDQILRADIEARYRSYQIGLEQGFLVIDEVREQEGLSALPTGQAIPRKLAEIIQKIYLGVGVVLSAEEARSILAQAGAQINPLASFTPPAPEPSPSPNGKVPVNAS